MNYFFRSISFVSKKNKVINELKLVFEILKFSSSSYSQLKNRYKTKRSQKIGSANIPLHGIRNHGCYEIKLC